MNRTLSEITASSARLLLVLLAALSTACPYGLVLDGDRCGFEGDGPFYLGRMETDRRFEQFTDRCALLEVIEADGFQGGGAQQHVEPAILLRDAVFAESQLVGTVEWRVYNRSGELLTDGSQVELWPGSWRSVEKGLVYESGRVFLNRRPLRGDLLTVEAALTFEDPELGAQQLETSGVRVE